MRSVNRLIEQFTDRKFDLRSVNHLIDLRSGKELLSSKKKPLRFTDRISA